MSKALCRAVLLTLSLLLILTMLCACADRGSVKNREYNESEVRTAAEELIRESEILNEIYWGRGIPYTEDANLSSGAYYPADEIYLNSIGVKTLEDLKQKTRGVFSTDMCEWVFESTLSSVGTGTGVLLSRYTQKWGGVNLDTPEYILVNKNHKVMLEDEVEYNYGSIKVLGAAGELVTVSIDCTVTNSEGLESKQTIKVDLIEEKDGWRIATPTYTVYSGEN